MPIRMIYEEGLHKPVVLCDHCHTIINDAGDGSYEWAFSHPGEPTPVYFTHKRCSHTFERAMKLKARDEMEVEITDWGTGELALFPLRLGNNLEIDWIGAVENARQLQTMLFRPGAGSRPG